MILAVLPQQLLKSRKAQHHLSLAAYLATVTGMLGTCQAALTSHEVGLAEQPCQPHELMMAALQPTLQRFIHPICVVLPAQVILLRGPAVAFT